MTPKTWLRTAAVVALVLALGACGGDDEPSPASAPASPTTATTVEAAAPDATVEVKEFKFTPKEIHVPVGGTVRWTNADAFEHTVTTGAVDGPENVPDGLVDESMPDAGTTATATFPDAGTFTYYCRRHNAMDGVVIVDA